MTATKRRTQAERTAASDKAMFKAAIKLSARDGPSSMTLAKIGKEAGFSGGLVSYRFGSKSNLLVATAERILELWQTRVVQPANADEKSIDGLEKMVALYFDAVRKKSDLMMAQFRLMNVSYSSYPELQPAFRGYDRHVRDLVVEAVNNSIAQGDVRKGVDAEVFAVSLVGLMRGIAVQYFVDSKGIDIDAATESTINFIETSLRR